MITIEKADVSGWKAALRGLRNPLNSWAKSDSGIDDDGEFIIGPADEGLCKRMNCHPEESKYRRMIIVTADVTAPLYWWKEYDTYKVGTVANSCSTMHKIHSKEFTLADFSTDYLLDDSIDTLQDVINKMNEYRIVYDATKNKKYWQQMIQLLPTSYNQKRTILLNYEVLANIYRQRKNHKLDEWHTFCDWIKTLPYSGLIIGESDDK